MERITFTYQGKEYTGELVRSENIAPAFYWITIDQPELRALLGDDDVGFTISDGVLVPASGNWSKQHQEILDSIIRAIESFI